MNMEGSGNIKRIKFEVLGDPKSQLRLKFRRMGSRIHTYVPEVTKMAEQNFTLQSLAHRPKELICGPVYVGLKIIRSIPKSMSKKNKLLALDEVLRPITKPDLSNYIKLIEDAITGIFYRDDAQIVGYLDIGKYYGLTPKIEVVIEYVE